MSETKTVRTYRIKLSDAARYAEITAAELSATAAGLRILAEQAREAPPTVDGTEEGPAMRIGAIEWTIVVRERVIPPVLVARASRQAAAERQAIDALKKDEQTPFKEKEEGV